MSSRMIFLLVSFMGCVIFADKSEEIAQIASKAQQMNAIYGQALGQLDELKSIIDYLWLAINKGAIKVADKEDIRHWKQKQDKAIKELQSIYKPSMALTEKELYVMVIGIKCVVMCLYQAITNEFKKLSDFQISAVSRSVNHIASVQSLENLMIQNRRAIEILKLASHNAGLSTINRIARKIDEFNEKYNIMKFIVGDLPVAMVLGATAIYLAPEYSEKVISLLPKGKEIFQYLSTQLGTLKKKEKVGQQNAGFYGGFVKFFKPNSYGQGVITILGGVANYAMTQDLSNISGIGPMIREFKRYSNSYWQRLKGFPALEKSQYSIIEHVTLDDERLIGVSEQVEELRNIVTYITNPEIFDKSNSNLEKGILIVGPTRNGKTHLAEATAGSINQALKSKGSRTRIAFRELKWGEVKWSSEGIKTIIEQARKNAPCILFIDEIHNLPLQTKEGGETLTEFLVGMSGINTENDAKHQVILLAATNQPDKLDSALLQPGRFGKIIYVGKPNYNDRLAYFNIAFKYDAVDTTDIDIEKIARLTKGSSYGKLASIIKNARFTALKLAQGLAQVHFQEQIDKLVYRFKQKILLTQEERHIVSIHQAGHALMYYVLNPRQQLELVTLRAKHPKIIEKRFFEHSLTAKEQEARELPKYGTLVTYNIAEALKLESMQDKEKLCKIKMAGYLAEQIILNLSGHNYHIKDRSKARQLTKAIILKGDKESDLSKTKLQTITREAEALFDKYEQEAYTILKAHESALRAIAQDLEQKATLYSEDFAQYGLSKMASNLPVVVHAEAA